MPGDAPRPRRALLATTHFEHVAGSELVLLEVAEHLLARGFRCDIAAASIGQPMRRIANRPGVDFHTTPGSVKPFTYDFAWFQTRLEPVMDYSIDRDEAPRTLFVFAHLDMVWSLTQPGALEEVLADVCLVLSEEGREHFAEAGLPQDRIRLLRNAAPASFIRAAGRPRPAIRRLLLVSNHPPAEALEAAEILRDRGVTVEHWGMGGTVRGRRLTAKHLDDADAVVSIGKTVPYALNARLPAFVYDHFGGPGWLNEANFAAAAATNFSGRCCRRKLTGADIAAEVVEGFDRAAAWAAALDEGRLQPYRLEPLLDALLAEAGGAPGVEARRAAMDPRALELRREANLARAAAQYFAGWRARVRQADRAKAEAEGQACARV